MKQPIVHQFLEQTAGENMTTRVKSVTRELTMLELGRLFEQDDFNAYPVQDRDEVVGLVSKFDYLSCFMFTPDRMMPRYDELMRVRVADVMSADFIYVGNETKLTRVLQLMVNHHVRSMPVIEAGQKLSGMISREDVMRALKRSVVSGAGT